MASGSPFSPSTTTIRTSPTPRAFNSFITPSQSFRPLLRRRPLTLRTDAGIPWSVEVLASGLTESDARTQEWAAIGELEKPLNVIGAYGRRWADPLARSFRAILGSERA